MEFNFNPILFRESVESLDLEQEVNRRNSTSRSYYCLFHSIKNMFSGLPSYSGLRTHENLYEFLLQGYNDDGYCKKKLKSLAYIMDTTRKLRVEADYKIHKEYTNMEALTAITNVSNCLKIVGQLTAAPEENTQSSKEL